MLNVRVWLYQSLDILKHGFFTKMVSVQWISYYGLHSAAIYDKTFSFIKCHGHLDRSLLNSMTWNIFGKQDSRAA